MKSKKLQAFRVYSVIVPSVVSIFLLELVYVLVSIPSVPLGSALKARGTVP